MAIEDKINLNELSDILGLDVKILRSHAKKGMPINDGVGGAVAWIAKNIVPEKKVRVAKIPKAKVKKEPVYAPVEPLDLSSLFNDGDEATVEEEISFNEARRRKEVAGALQAELNLAKDREQVANIDDLMEAFSDALVNVRASLTSLSSRMSGMLAHQDEDEVRKLIDKEMHDTLDALSGYYD